MSNRAVPAGSVISSRSVGSAVSDQSESAWPDCASAAEIDSRYVSTPPARRRDQVTSPMRIRRPGSAPRRARGSCARDRSARCTRPRPADMSLARSVASLPSARISRAIASGSPGGTSRTARDSRHTGSLRRPSVVTTGIPCARAAINVPRRLLAPSAYGCATTSHACRTADSVSGGSAPVAWTRAASSGCRAIELQPERVALTAHQDERGRRRQARNPLEERLQLSVAS